MDINPDLEKSKRWMRVAVIQALLPVLLLGGYIFFASNTWLHLFSSHEQDRQRVKLVQLVTLAQKALEPTLGEIRAGKISEAEGLEIIRPILRKMVFQDEYGQNYFFLVRDTGYGLVHPFEPQNEGDYLMNEHDANGKYFLREMMTILDKSPGGGFVSYFYLPPNGTVPQEKNTYVIYLPEIHSVLGTGIYLDRFYQEQAQIFARISWTLLGLIGLIGLASTLSLYQGYKRNQLLVKERGIRIKAEKDTRLSEENLRALFDHMHDAVIIHDTRGTVVQVNKRMLELYDVPESEALNYTMYDLASKLNQDKRSLEELWQDVNSGQAVVIEWTAMRPRSQKKIPVEAALNPVRWYGKEMILAVVRDITERKMAENALEDSEKKYRLLTENMNDVIFQMTKDMVFTYVSPSDERWRGFRSEEVVGRPLWNFLSPASREVLRRSSPDFRENVLRQDGPLGSFEVEMVRKDGTAVWAEVVPTAVFDEGGNFDGYQGVARDISERKHNEERLRHSEERFRVVAEKLAEGLVVVDSEGLIVEWNDAFAEMVKIAGKTAIGRHIWDMQFQMLAPQDRTPQRLEQLREFTLSILENGGDEYLNRPRELLPQNLRLESRILEQTLFRFQTSQGNHLATLVRDITDQRLAQEKIEYELKKLESLRKIDARIIDQSPLKESMQVVVQQACEHLNADGVQILLYDPQEENLECIAAQGVERVSADCRRYPQQTGPGWEVLHTGELVILHNQPSSIANMCPCFVNRGFKSYVGLPVRSRTGTSGILEVFLLEDIEPDKEWLDYLETLAGQAAIALEAHRLMNNLEESNEQLQQAYDATIAGWSKALELRDEETKGHSDRVMHLASRLAEHMGIAGQELADFRRGVLLHDIGKMGIPDSILLKPGPLTPEEWVIMKRHPIFAYDLLRPIPYLRSALDVPRYHHERWDGSGYPDGRRGEEIPLTARIFAVVDVWDALISDRPYRPGWAEEDIVRYLRENKAILFDPVVVDAFLLLKETSGN